MTEKEAKTVLENEGFARVYTWTDEPNAFYDEHEHENLTAHIILEGSMELTMGGVSRVYKAGERIDVPANMPHSAKMGLVGCTYIIGE